MQKQFREIEELRIKIDAIDRQLVRLLNQRATHANQIGEIKRRLGLPVYVPEREEQVIENVKKSNPGPLSGEAIGRIYERIIDESRRLEREEMERKLKKNEE
ncbi:chorismate mutase [Calditrichota bacterium LG25]